jgi:hypothetical protein
MPLLPLIIENGLRANGNSIVTGSVVTTLPYTNTIASGSFTGSFSGSGAGITGARATITNMPAGTMILLSANETPVTGTGNATAFTYVLAANSYSRIIIEAETRFRNTANTNGTATFNILVGAVNKRAQQIEIDNMGAANQFDVGRVIKYSEAITAGGTITVTTTGVANGSWQVDALRVYGVT